MVNENLKTNLPYTWMILQEKFDYQHGCRGNGI
jgi:hypothetical protein